jgi:hypothetical protein
MVAETPYNIHRSREKTLAEQSLFDLIYRARGIYIQQSGGYQTILASLGQDNEDVHEQVMWLLARIAPKLSTEQALNYMRIHGRVFFSALDWIEYLKSFDACFGHRFHGNMAAIAANRLGVVITHDSRTEELVEYMKIPRVSSAAFNVGDLSLGHLLDNIDFDPDAFDGQRCQIASQWLDLFEPIGIELEDYVHVLADGHR